jgi:heat shock protein HslJ
VRTTRSNITRSIIGIGIGLATSLLLTACGGDDDAGSAPTSADLDGQSFVATEIDGADIVEGSSIVIAFDSGSVIVDAGCNTQRADYSVTEDGVLETTAMLSTMMACDDALMAQDALVAGVVTSGPTVALDGDVLTIAGADASITLSSDG